MLQFVKSVVDGLWDSWREMIDECGWFGGFVWLLGVGIGSGLMFALMGLMLVALIELMRSFGGV